MSNPVDILAQAAAGIAAVGALGTAASGLVDATKAFWGGVSNFGYTKIVGGLEPFSAALEAATAGWHHSRKTSWFRVTPESDPPADWKDIVRANWINGRPTADQKAAVKALINVGLSADTASSVAEAGHVNEDILKTAATAIGNGTTPPPEGRCV